KRKTKKRGVQAQRSNSPAPCRRLPYPKELILHVVGNEGSIKNWKVLRYFRWNKSDLKDGRRDGESNKAFPLTPPSPSGPSGRGRTCERFVKVRGMSTSIPRTEARRQGSPTITYTTERLNELGPSR